MGVLKIVLQGDCEFKEQQACKACKGLQLVLRF